MKRNALVWFEIPAEDEFTSQDIMAEEKGGRLVYTCLGFSMGEGERAQGDIWVDIAIILAEI